MISAQASTARLTRALGLVLVGAVTVVCMSSGQAAAASPKKGPSGVKFYSPPTRLPPGHGHLIWERSANKATSIPGARSTRLVLYTSTTPQGRPTAVSGLVSVPKGRPPKHGWPVISYAHGTTGVADVCAPSRVTPDDPNAPLVTYVNPVLAKWIAAGYAVLRTDYQGLGTPGPHAYLNPTAEGRSVVDIVSAARQLDRSIGKRYLIAGHSQGGHAALSAAGLAKRWAPGLELRGTISYAPGSHILEQAKLLPNLTTPSPPLAALSAVIFYSAASQSKAVSAQRLLSDAALPLFAQVDHKCIGQLDDVDSVASLPPSQFFRTGADLGPLYSELAKMNPDVKTAAPILMLQGTADTVVFPTFTDQLDQELVARGNTITYVTLPGVDHETLPAESERQVLEFMKRRLPVRR